MKVTILLFIIPILSSCGSSSNLTDNSDSDPTNSAVIAAYDHLHCVYDADERPCFVNENKDTIIPFGKYEVSFSEDITQIGFVADSKGKILCINVEGKELFEVYNFDNGPDYVEEGLFRIVKDGKIGYANEDGEVVIEPQYQCAYPFEKGKAKVALNCNETIEFEMKKWESDTWFYIDKSGKKIE